MSGMDSINFFSQAALIHEKRAGVLAGNLANVSTPGYKAKDIDFRQALKDFSSSTVNAKVLSTTDSGHIKNTDKYDLLEAQFRVSTQPSLDGNTVDGQIEKTEWSENALRYVANMTFLDAEFQKMKMAIRGGR